MKGTGDLHVVECSGLFSSFFLLSVAAALDTGGHSVLFEALNSLGFQTPSRLLFQLPLLLHLLYKFLLPPPTFKHERPQSQSSTLFSLSAATAR